ncbi:uncharacterized protein ARMOST_22171 [Armillaria ostoyae]|uniref:Uncharacterized protein n=1 Tax=Armillaria ostoyae TaxID=47428 RepID=A0A284SC42_ARMOS|nr:uncharacterized protein ARMOST_22171 [Armillaria ostoyae]
MPTTVFLSRALKNPAGAWRRVTDSRIPIITVNNPDIASGGYTKIYLPAARSSKKTIQISQIPFNLTSSIPFCHRVSTHSTWVCVKLKTPLGKDPIVPQRKAEGQASSFKLQGRRHLRCRKEDTGEKSRLFERTLQTYRGEGVGGPISQRSSGYVQDSPSQCMVEKINAAPSNRLRNSFRPW